MHAIVLIFVLLSNGPGKLSGFHFIVGLNDLATLTPEGVAAIATTTPRNIESLPNLTSFDHTEDTAAKEKKVRPP